VTSLVALLIRSNDCMLHMQASGPGTVSYAAPEALSKNQVSPASDMFSFGCVLWELLSMKEPWAELSGNAFQVMSKIIYEKEHLQIEDIPTEVRDRVPGVIEVLELCFSYEPALRPAAERVYDVLAAAIELL
jgi:serine/threonine protein kinase